MVMFLLSGLARAEGVFSWVEVQVPSLVSKYVKGLVGGVEELPCACLYKYGNRFRQMHVRFVQITQMFLLSSQGVSLHSSLNALALE